MVSKAQSSDYDLRPRESRYTKEESEQEVREENEDLGSGVDILVGKCSSVRSVGKM